MRISLFALLMACAAVAGHAQTIQVTTTPAPVDYLTVGDVDFIHSTTPKWLFTIDLAAVPPVPGGVEVEMEITGSVSLSTGERYDRAIYLKSTRFLLNPTRSFTNLDFLNPALRASYSVDEAAKKMFETAALPTGTMPAGTYDFSVLVTPVSSALRPVNDGFQFVLSNPSRVELLLPLEGDDAVPQFPLFQWLFDGTVARLHVYERLPGQASYEEAASGIPHHSVELTSRAYQYPTSGVRSLVPGKTYVWYVEGVTRSTGGQEQTIRSPLRSFAVASTASTSEASLLDAIERALGPSYRALFEQLRAGGYTTVDGMRVDGAPLPTVDFLRLLNQFQIDPERVLSVRVE